MKKHVRWLVYILAVFSIIIITFVLYHMIDAKRTERQKKVYKERLHHLKKMKPDH